jgi:hypothetical protein
MGSYAKVSNYKVIKVIAAEPEFFESFVDSGPGQWIKTSYNMRGGVYYDPATGGPHADQEGMIAADEGRQRKNYAGIGYSYDPELNAFIPPKPYNSWILNTDLAQWEAPVAMPEDAGTGDPPKVYFWDEASNSWQLIPSGNSD